MCWGSSDCKRARERMSTKDVCAAPQQQAAVLDVSTQLAETFIKARRRQHERAVCCAVRIWYAPSTHSPSPQVALLLEGIRTNTLIAGAILICTCRRKARMGSTDLVPFLRGLCSALTCSAFSPSWCRQAAHFFAHSQAASIGMRLRPGVDVGTRRSFRNSSHTTAGCLDTTIATAVTSSGQAKQRSGVDMWPPSSCHPSTGELDGWMIAAIRIRKFSQSIDIVSRVQCKLPQLKKHITSSWPKIGNINRQYITWIWISVALEQHLLFFCLWCR